MQSRVFARSLTIAALVIAPNVLAQGPASGNPDSTSEANQEATDAFWNGKRAYESGEYGLAQEQFSKAFALTHDPEVLFDIAQAQRKDGKCEQAIRSYRDFLRDAPNSPLALRAEKQVTELQSTCVSPALAHSEPDTSHVSGPATTARAHLAASVPQAAPLPPTAPPVAPRPRESGAIRNWSIATFSSSLVVGGIAAGLELWNRGRYDQWRTRDTELAQGTGTTSREINVQWAARQQSNDELGQSISRVDNEALILGLGAGALLATSAIQFYSSSIRENRRTSDSPERKHMPSLAIGPRHVGVAVAW